MRKLTLLWGLILLRLLGATARAGDGQAHQPTDGEGHAHAHPRIDVAHAIVTESPVPETEIQFRYSFADAGDGTELALSNAIEYAFVPTFSLELAVPYAVVDPDGGGPFGHFDNVEVAAKFATYAFADEGFIPAAGLAVSFPTGREERGVGSDHIVELEPFVRAGLVRGPFHLVGQVGVGIPLNQTHGERDEQDFTLGYNAAVIYHAMPKLQALVELHGESVFGDGDGEHAFYVSPGVTFQPFADKSINLGVGVSLPLTDERDFDYAVNLLAIFHL